MVKNGNKRYFSSNYQMSDIDIENREGVIDAFVDRMENHCFRAIETLISAGCIFGAGTLCFTTIDVLAHIEYGTQVGERIRMWLERHDGEHVNEKLATILYDNYRNGLTHEGRIKKSGYFSLDCESISETENEVLINPRHLLEVIRREFMKYVTLARTDKDTYVKIKEYVVRIISGA